MSPRAPERAEEGSRREAARAIRGQRVAAAAPKTTADAT
jgi:hypothetical protein